MSQFIYLLCDANDVVRISSVPQHQDNCDEYLQWFITRHWHWPSDGSVFVRLGGCLQHCWSWPISTPSVTSVWSPHKFGLRDIVLQWLSCVYLTDDLCYLQQPGCSFVVYIVCSVPLVGTWSMSFYSLHGGPCQGSPAAPGEPSLYDDNQLYIHCHRDNMMPVIDRLECCLIDVSHWMSAICLKLNTEKMELFWTGLRHAAAVLGCNNSSLHFGEETVAPSDQVQVLVVIFSSGLCLVKRIQCHCDTVLLDLPTSTCPKMFGHRLHEDTCACLHNVSSVLLQHNFRRVTSPHNWHATACAERRSRSRHLHL